MKVRGAWVGLITMTLLAVVAVAVNYFHTFSDSSSLEAVVEKLPLPEQAVCDLDSRDLSRYLPHTAALDTHFNRAVKGRLVSGLPVVNYNQSTVGHSPQSVLGYVGKVSFATSEDLRVFFAKGLHGSGQTLSRAMFYNAATESLVRSINLQDQNLALDLQQCFSYRHEGCRFNASVDFNLESFEPGGYYLYLMDDIGESSAPIFFNVLPASEVLRTTKVFVLLSDTTWHAYNYFGGGSLYGIFADSPGPQKSIERENDKDWRLYSVGFDRPQQPMFAFSVQNKNLLDQNSTSEMVTPRQAINICADKYKTSARGHGCFRQARPSPVANMIFSAALIEGGVDHGILSMGDFQRLGPETLPDDSILVVNGHNEYWTKEMREALGRYIERGGNVLNMSGNVDWWQIKIKDRTMYQDQGLSYRTKLCNSMVPDQYQSTGQTGYFVKPGSERFFGVSYRYAGYSLSYVKDHNLYLDSHPHITEVAAEHEGRLTVLAEEHPLFDGMQIAHNGDLMTTPLFMDDEVDGMPLLEDALSPHFEFAGSPKTRPLAKMIVWASNRHYGKNGAVLEGFSEPAVIVETQPFEGSQSGRVISIGAIGPAYALLQNDPMAKRFLMNGLNYLRMENAELAPLGD